MSLSLADLRSAFPRLGRAYATLRVWVQALYRSISAEGLDYRATSLAYTTLLSIVPGLAFCFSLLKTFGVNKHLEPFLLELLAPLGDKAQVLTEHILDFVTRINVGVLGFMGLMTLIYVSVSMLSKIETAFNHIWRIAEPRSLARRAADYLSVILLGPLLMFSAIGLTASMPGAEAVRRLVAYEPFGTLFFLAGKLLSLLLVIAAFTFVYLYIPNTRVPWRAALLGGTVGGLSWKIAGFWFAHFVTTSSSYHAIYSSLVIVILCMIWLDLSWLILLLGGQAAMYFQHPYYLRGYERFGNLGSRIREGLGLSLMTLIARRFAGKQSPWSIDELAGHLSLPWVTVKEALTWLQRGGLLEATGREDDSYLPAQDIAAITVRDVLSIMRSSQDDGAMARDTPGGMLPEADGLVAELEREAMSSAAASLTLREFALLSEEPLDPQDTSGVMPKMIYPRCQGPAVDNHDSGLI